MIDKLLPAWLHRALMPLAHNLRHRWRKWSGAPIAGVSVVLANRSGEILLLRHSYGPKVWAIPGGGLKSGEDPAQAARREVAEELGVELEQVLEIGTLEEELSGAPHIAHVFAATCDAIPVPDRREVIEARFFAADALPDPLGRVTARRIAAWREHSENTRGNTGDNTADG